MPPCPTRRQEGAAKALTLARQNLAGAVDFPEECNRILEEKMQRWEMELKKAQRLGHRMDQGMARFRRSVENGEKAVEAMHKAQESKRNRRYCRRRRTSTGTRRRPCFRPPLAPHVNASLVETLEAWTGLVENMWDPDARQPPEHLVQAIQEATPPIQSSSALLRPARHRSQWMWGRMPTFSTWMPTISRRSRAADCEEAHAQGGPMQERASACKNAVERTPGKRLDTDFLALILALHHSLVFLLGSPGTTLACLLRPDPWFLG